MSTTTLYNEKTRATGERSEAKKVLIPKLRFQEFSGEWNNKSMSDFTKINQGLQIPISERFYEKTDDNYFYITNEFLRKDSAKSYFIKNPSESVICYEDDILMTRTGNTGQVVTGVHGAFHNNFFKIKYDETCSKWFLYFFLTSHKTQHTILKLAGTSTIPDLNHGDFYKITLNIPTLPEQQKIASFLSAVDEKIQQLSRKKELLEQYKKGVMQQLFSEKLRFKDENGKDYPDWEEKKLGDVCEIIGGGTPDTNISEYWGGEIQWFTPTEIKSDFVYNSLRTITELGLQKSSAKKLPIGTILLTTRATIGEVSISQKECSTNQGFQSLIVKEGNNNIFIFNWIKRNKHELIARANGSTFTEISKSAIEKISLNVPCLPEQQKIAIFLSSIDKKIDGVNQQLAQTQTFKKGLLQQMFV